MHDSKKSFQQRGFALLEVLVAVGLLGVVALYTAQAMQSVAKEQSNQSIGNDIANVYASMFKMLFYPELKVTGSAPYIINTSLEALQLTATPLGPQSPFEYLYKPFAGSSDPQFYRFFNGGVDVCNPAAAVSLEEPFISCFQDLRFGNDIRLIGARVDVIRVPFFGFLNTVNNSNLNNIKPARAVIYLSGLNSKQGFGEYRRLIAAVKQQLVTSNRIELNDTSAHVETYLAKYDPASTMPGQYEYFSGSTRVPFDKVLENTISGLSYNLDSGEWGAAIVVDFARASVLRADGSVAVAKDKQLCWSFEQGTAGSPDTTCAKVVYNSTLPAADQQAALYINGGLAYKSSTMRGTVSDRDRTPVESVMGWFENNQPARINIQPCPASFFPKLAVATSSFSNSDMGDFSQENAQNNSDNNQPAEPMSGLIYSWEQVNPATGPDYWQVSASVGILSGPQVQTGIVNPKSVSFIAFRWCEK